jgi:hypothetical protein
VYFFILFGRVYGDDIMDIPEIIGGIIVLILGMVILLTLTIQLNFALGSIFVGLFVAAGIAWFIKEVLS